jgi:type I restriction-modification system DNA methylase subunit
MASLNKTYTDTKLGGKIYTPTFIIEKILNDIGYDNPSILGKNIIDPACGDGRFLIQIVKRIIKHSGLKDLSSNLSYVSGWDIDASAIHKAIEHLDSLTAKYDINIKWNLSVRDSLSEYEEGKYDFVVGNPPYIRIQHLRSAQRKYIQENYPFCQSGSTDIYIAFYELGNRLLTPSGKLGFITPNTFFNSQTAKQLRRFFEKNNNLIQISNYGTIQLFDNASTYSAIVVFDKQKRKSFLYQSAIDKFSFKERKIDFQEIAGSTFWQLSTGRNTHTQGNRLLDIAEIHVGITTLADRVYISPFLKKKKNEILLRTKLGGDVWIEKDILRPIIKASKLKKSDEPIREYVIFPYHKHNGKIQIIPENQMRENFPKAFRYLLSLKDILDKRDAGKPNKVSWYAFGRTQGLETSFGKKILFSPMNKEPNFILSENEEASFYSGYCIKYKGDYSTLLQQLNSIRMKKYIARSARDFRSGWKAYNKAIVGEFIIENH